MRLTHSTTGKMLLAVFAFMILVISLGITETLLKRSARITPGKQLFRPGQPVPVASSGPKTVLEIPGKVRVVNDHQCGQGRSPAGSTLAVLGSENLPPYASTATVFLNGWHVRYLGDDQHVRILSAAIHNIHQEDSTLKWEASGTIQDEDSEERYEFCYYYTVIEWNQAIIEATADHDDRKGDNAVLSSRAINSEDTALVTVPSYFQNGAFASKNAAALPQGFAFVWNDESRLFFPACFSCPVDHHLLQVSYNVDHAESFVEKDKSYELLPPPPITGPASITNSGFASWDIFGIFKDNDAKRDFGFYVGASALGGDDVRLIQPPFAVRPVEDVSGGCITNPGGVVTKQYVIGNLPFEEAVPMLTGWDLQYSCSDQHVKDIGIWLSDIAYVKLPGSPVGTLSYKVSSVLCDNDCSPGHIFHHKVSILGLQHAAKNVILPAPDLLPVSLPGTTTFCRRDGQGRLLIRVQNQGNAAPAPSITRVGFGPLGDQVPVDVSTPSISPGDFVDLVVSPPPSCSQPTGCSFKISADKDNQLNESNENNNSVIGTCGPG